MKYNTAAFEMNQIDAAYINTLVELINACRTFNVKIDKVYHYQNGWKITFEGYEHADAICHDGSYGSPCYMAGFLKDGHNNDWSCIGEWETIGFPWDGDDVSVHDSYTLAKMIAALHDGNDWHTYEI